MTDLCDLAETSKEDGRVPSAPGSHASHEAPAGLRPSGFDPSRETCKRCGRDENPPWSAPSPLWNAVMRGGSINGDALFDDMVCATCFMVLAEEAGVATLWRVDAERVNVPLETVTPSGRYWDQLSRMWIVP